ncbi:MAG: PIG-L deacetylase family protein [Planctomycetaceae bacterium]
MPSQSTSSVESDVSLNTPYRFTRREEDGTLRRTADLAELLRSDDLGNECWLFVGPHDDDLCIGGGLLMQAGAEAGVDVRAVIITDGRLGYCREEDRESIVRLRRAETLASFATLGIEPDKVTNFGFPDGGLNAYQGRRPPLPGKQDLCGYVGLQNWLTYALRRHRPARVFVPTPTDLHPDHRVTHSELMISLFHATGAIWPELGPPMIEVPRVCEMAVYCDFAEPPNLEVVSDDARFQKKLDSIAAYKSQLQIGELVNSVKRAGAYEYFREVEFRLYSAETYKPLFRD